MTVGKGFSLPSFYSFSITLCMRRWWEISMVFENIYWTTMIDRRPWKTYQSLFLIVYAQTTVLELFMRGCMRFSQKGRIKIASIKMNENGENAIKLFVKLLRILSHTAIYMNLSYTFSKVYMDGPCVLSHSRKLMRVGNKASKNSSSVTNSDT